MSQPISRRKFLSLGKRLALFSFAPIASMKIPGLDDQLRPGGFIPEKQIPFIKPEWLTILSEGVYYYPKTMQHFDDLKDDELEGLVYKALKDAMDMNFCILKGTAAPNTENLNTAVKLNKTAQFITEHCSGRYQFSESFPPVYFTQDPMRGQILMDMPMFAHLYYLQPKMLGEDFLRFDAFDVELIESSLTYFNRACTTLENAYDIAPERYREPLNRTQALCHTYLGLSYNFLGDLETALWHYLHALELKPYDGTISTLIRNIEKNASYLPVDK